MDVNMMPSFTSQLKLKSGEVPPIRNRQNMPLQYYLKNRDMVSQIWIKDFSSGTWIDGKRAYYATS
ncbi:MAG: hypothetical protein Q9N34_02415 [Aquificota bacterium]|nr:hypothetical protein [Aquificota bacterium]